MKKIIISIIIALSVIAIGNSAVGYYFGSDAADDLDVAIVNDLRG